MHPNLYFRHLVFSLILLILLVPQSCTSPGGRSGFQGLDDNGGLLTDIVRRGVLVAITDDNPINYFIHQGEERGYQYEMLSSFAHYLGVDLQIIVEQDPYQALQYLKRRQVDLVAMDLPVNPDYRKNTLISEPLFTSRQVLVQRKPDNWRRMRDMKTVESLMIRDLGYLGQKTIALPANALKQFYLADIQHASNYSVIIDGIDRVTQTDLIEAVALNGADYTIAYEHTAKALAQIYHDLDISTPVSPDIPVSWAVRKGAVNLMGEINTWIEKNEGSREFTRTYASYFNNARQVRLALGHAVKNHSISDFDEVIRESSKLINWDWRLVSALIYKESKFNIHAVSHRGAFGLMQLMPQTAERFGAHINSTPAEQITAGIKLIRHLDKALKNRVPDPEERKKFILAAYNIGLAHIIDAQNLAEKHGKDPAVWYDNVEYYLLAKSQPEFYNDPVVKYGRVKGIETKQFVRDVLEKYDQYKTLASR
ncbi:MAG TPA: transporter substrate-binding domain-containing protein [Lentimicrobium sp.]|nr:transporter substrate-binding domain-containing protein [Lentimicrobium sp.]